MSEIKLISEWYVRPEFEVNQSKRRHNLGPSDLSMLLLGYSKFGHLFIKSHNFSPSSFLHTLKLSLSLILTHFYPLAGQLVTVRNLDDHSSYIYIDCHKGPGSKLIHAAALHVSIKDVLSPDSDIPRLIQSFFHLGEEDLINHDGHTKPLLSVQLTQLADGLFIGTCINHCVADGTSSFRFLNLWSELFMASSFSSSSINFLPVYQNHPIIKLPYLDPGEFIIRLPDAHLSERMFHFTRSSMARLKVQANAEAYDDGSNNSISSFQALSALVWRSVTRARKLCTDERTTCGLVANLRPRFQPPLSQDYFGNFLMPAKGSADVGELVVNSLGWAALLLHRAVGGLNDKVGQGVLEEGSELLLPGLGSHGSNPVLMAGSPRIEFYGPEFGLGRAVAVRMGYENKDGMVYAFPGAKDDGSVDLQVCVSPMAMCGLLLDEEFMKFAAPTLNI